MRFHYDKKSDALYIRFNEKRYSESSQVQEGVVFDYDRGGKIIGIEILDASSVLPREFREARIPASLSLSTRDFFPVAR